MAKICENREEKNGCGLYVAGMLNGYAWEAWRMEVDESYRWVNVDNFEAYA